MSFAKPKLSFILPLLGYLLLVVAMSVSHEVWRDEVRAFNIVTESESFLSIFSVLRNEGHPFLWYAILGFANEILQNPIALKVSGVFAAALAAMLFLAKAPFPLPVRCLWLFGFYPAYEYSVMSRNYGIGMLLIFAIASLFPRRNEFPLRFGLLLAVLAQTSAYGIIHALAFLLLVLVEPVFFEKFRNRDILISKTVTVMIALIGIGFSVYSIYPEKTTVVTELHSLGLASVVSAVLQGMVQHGASFHDGLVSPFPLVVPFLLFSLYVLLLRSPAVVVYLLAVVVGMESFNALIYSGAALRHQGFLLLGIVSAIWMYFSDSAKITNFRFFSSELEKLLLNCGLSIVFVLQIYAGLKAMKLDFVGEFSSAKEFSKFIQSNPELSDYIITAEPDYVLESIPYYLKNKTFLVREEKFGAVVSFTSVSKPKLSLGQFLVEVAELSKQHGKPSIMLLPLELEERASFDVGYGRTFTVSKGEVQQLKAEAVKLRCFDRAYTDENYCAWSLR